MRKMKSLIDLPRELLGQVFQCLHDPLDRVRFARVCSSFRSVSKENNPCQLSRALLMLPPTCDAETHEFFSLADSSTYRFRVPKLSGKWCCGSSYGWLFLVDFDSGDIGLLNPLTGSRIPLPHISTFTNPPKPDFAQDRNEVWYIKKAVLSAPPDPKEGEFFVIAIFTTFWALAFCRPGDEKWTTLRRECGPCEDVIYRKGKFHAITNWGALIAWDLLDVSSPCVTVLIEPTRELPYFRYLVDFPNGDLLKISKLEDENARTVGFKVFKLDESRTKREWVETNSLGDYAVFLGYNRAITLSEKENPGCWANHIYFTEDNAEKYYYTDEPRGGCNDVGVYNLTDGRIEEFYHNHPFWTSHCIWITPTIR